MRAVCLAMACCGLVLDGLAWGDSYRFSRRRHRSQDFFYGPNGSSSFLYYRGPVGVPYGCAGYAPVIGGPYYGGASGPPGFANYGPVYSYTPMAPIVMQAHPRWIGRNPFDNDVLRRSLLENELRWNRPLLIGPAKGNTLRQVAPSTKAAKTKSKLAQAQGDRYMNNQEYAKAYERYKLALKTAPDRADPFFRTAFALAALRQFHSAIQYLKRGLQLNPDWPNNGESLARVFGRRNPIAKSTTMGNATRWAKEDIRDSDRLFLVGVLLHFDNQIDKSAVLFAGAYRLAGGGEHLKSFLRTSPYVKRLVAKRQSKLPVTPAPPQPPVKKPVAKKALPANAFNLQPPKPPIPPPRLIVPPPPQP